MKTYLFLITFTCSYFFTIAQNSDVSFDHYKGLSTSLKKELSDTYHQMNGLRYHYFTLVNPAEKQKYSTAQLVQKSKTRAAIITSYFVQEVGVPPENLTVVYGGSAPRLSLYKSKSVLTPSGEIVLEEDTRQCFDFNTKASKAIVTKSGYTFSFLSNAFETLLGKQLINENIQICIWEFSSKKSLIYAGVTTTANGKMLETAGSFYIEATLNGKKLRLQPHANYQVSIPTTKQFNDMHTYYGAIYEGNIDWSINNNEPAVFSTTTDNLAEEIEAFADDVYFDAYGEVVEDAYYESDEAIDFYALSAGKLGWINCDRFYDIINPTNLIVRLDHDEPLVVRLVFRAINSVLPVYANSNHNDQYEISGVPQGEKALLLAYSVKDNNTLLGYKEITIGENKIEHISLNKLSKQRFIGAVSELLSY